MHDDFAKTFTDIEYTLMVFIKKITQRQTFSKNRCTSATLVKTIFPTVAYFVNIVEVTLRNKEQQGREKFPSFLIEMAHRSPNPYQANRLLDHTVQNNNRPA
mmetsp:Transcript_19256/g.43853  ORF Transcript_19256/g.43853 Transcript_19256/m.43853 type:complete len:102 (+) Transcript_19256:53-358(+)